MTKPRHPTPATSDIEYLYWCRTCQTLTVFNTDDERTTYVHNHTHAAEEAA